MKHINETRAKKIIELAQTVFPGDPFSKSKIAPNVAIRTALFNILLEYKESPTAIGRYFDVKHSNIYFAKKVLPTMIRFDSDFKEKYHALTMALLKPATSESITHQEIKDAVRKLSRQLFVIGYSPKKIQSFWNECISETIK